MYKTTIEMLSHIARVSLSVWNMYQGHFYGHFLVVVFYSEPEIIPYRRSERRRYRAIVFCVPCCQLSSSYSRSVREREWVEAQQ